MAPLLQRSSCVQLQQQQQPHHQHSAVARQRRRRRALPVLRSATTGSSSSSAAAQSDRASSPLASLASLDSLLGSRDEEADAGEPQQPQRAEALGLAASDLTVPDWAWSALREPRVVPLASNALYYCFLLVFVSFYVVQLGSGPEAADDLLYRLTNDHAAVGGGDTLRLFTSAFVVEAVPQLIVALVALATLAGELESLLGYSAFWATWCLVVLSGAFADAALSSQPVTFGPAAGVAGLAAALLAHHARNWRIEQQLQQAQGGEIPRAWELKEDAFNAARRAALRAGAEQEDEEAATAGAAAAASSSGAASAGQQQQQRRSRQQPPPATTAAGDPDEAGEMVDVAIEAPLSFMEDFTVRLPREGQAFVTLGGAACSVVSALRDAFDTDGPSDWTGLASGFAAGLVLGWLVAPVYELAFKEVDAAQGRADSGGGSSGDSSRAAAVAALTAGSSSSGTGSGDRMVLLPVLRDTRPPAARANAVVGYAAVLFAGLGAWLLSQGAFGG